MRHCVLVVLMLVIHAPTGYAADGVLEINQACATSPSGCFPGDGAGFPVTISQSGSYQLTSNLTISGVDTIGISVTGDSVTVDLHGFTISGPNTFVSDTPSCTAGSTALGSTAGAGILSSATSTIVRNGIVRQMGGSGVYIDASFSRIEGMLAEYNCGYGFHIRDGSLITGSQARRSRLAGIWVSTNSFGGGSLVEQSVSYDNMSYGIHLGPGSLARGCVVGGNRDLGFFGDPQSGVGDSIFHNNTGGVAGGLTVGCNMFNSGFTSTVVCSP